MQAAQLGPVLDALSTLLWTMENATEPLTDGTRRVKSPADAVLLSKASDSVASALPGLLNMIPWKAGKEFGKSPPFETFASDDPSSGWERQDVGDAKVFALDENAPATMIVAAFQCLADVVAFPNQTVGTNRTANRQRKRRWLALDVVSEGVTQKLRSGSAYLRAVELGLLREEGGPGPETVLTVQELGDFPSKAAARWDSIEAIDDLLNERVLATVSYGWLQRPPEWKATIPVEHDIEVRANGADVTGRTPQWCLGPGYARFLNESIRLRVSAATHLLAYLSSRRSFDRSYRPMEEPDVLDRALDYLNNAPQIRVLWTELLRRDERLRRYVTEALNAREQASNGTPGLTPGEQAVFDALNGTCLDAAALAHKDCCNTSPQTVREHVASIRKKQPRSIEHRSGHGYFRPDAPPDWDDVRPPRRRRGIRTA